MVYVIFKFVAKEMDTGGQWVQVTIIKGLIAKA